MRACILNATKMGVYDVTKGYITEYTGWERKDIRTAFGSAFVAGFFMTCTVSPADNLRTRLMNQPTDKKIYTGFTDCLVKTVKTDGVLSLWCVLLYVLSCRAQYYDCSPLSVPLFYLDGLCRRGESCVNK